jgi:hypothetical protein
MLRNAAFWFLAISALASVGPRTAYSQGTAGDFTYSTLVTATTSLTKTPGTTAPAPDATVNLWNDSGKTDFKVTLTAKTNNSMLNAATPTTIDFGSFTIMTLPAAAGTYTLNLTYAYTITIIDWSSGKAIPSTTPQTICGNISGKLIKTSSGSVSYYFTDNLTGAMPQASVVESFAGIKYTLDLTIYNLNLVAGVTPKTKFLQYSAASNIAFFGGQISSTALTKRE